MTDLEFQRWCQSCPYSRPSAQPLHPGPRTDRPREPRLRRSRPHTYGPRRTAHSGGICHLQKVKYNTSQTSVSNHYVFLYHYFYLLTTVVFAFWLVTETFDLNIGMLYYEQNIFGLGNRHIPEFKPSPFFPIWLFTRYIKHLIHLILRNHINALRTK